MAEILFFEFFHDCDLWNVACIADRNNFEIPSVFLQRVPSYKPLNITPTSAEVTATVVKTEPELESLCTDLNDNWYSPPPTEIMDVQNTDNGDSSNCQNVKKEVAISKHLTSSDNLPELKDEAQNLNLGSPSTRRVTVQKKRATRRKRKLKREKKKLDVLKKSKTKQGTKRYFCRSCSYTTTQNRYLEHHLRGHETSDKVFKCNFCELEFSG